MITASQATIRHKYRNQLLATPPSKEIKVLMIGNNPREMGCLNIHLRNFKWKRFAVNATFDLEEGWRIVQYFKPDYILIEDSFGEAPIRNLIAQLRSKKSTRFAAVALLKADNLTQLLIPGVQDYLLKENIVSDTFAFEVLSAIALKMQEDKNKACRVPETSGSWIPILSMGKRQVEPV